MGSLTANAAHSLEGPSIHDDPGHNHARREDHLTEIADSTCSTAASDLAGHPKSPDLPPHVRRTLELLDNFDITADQVISGVKELVNATRAVLAQCSPDTRR